MIAIYVRVSTEIQANEGTSLQSQKQAGILWAHSQNEEYKIYEDGGVSGGTFNRPQFEAMTTDISTGLVQKVWVADMDRLSRARPGDLDNIFMLFEEAKVKLYIAGVYQPLDDPEQMLNPYFSAIMAYLVRSKIKKLTRKGKRDSRDLGDATFSDAYGYRQELVSSKKVWVIHEPEAEIVRLLYQLYIEGKSQRDIELYLKDHHIYSRSGGYWYRAMISRTLTRLFYAGKTRNVAGEIIDSRRIPPIISWEQFLKVQEIASSKNCKLSDKIVGSKPIVYAYSSIIKCGVCQRSFIHKRKAEKEYFACQHDPDCGQKMSYIRKELFEEVINENVTHFLMSWFEAEKILSAQLQNVSSQQESDKKLILTLEKNKVSLEKKKSNLINAISDGTITSQDAKHNISEIRLKLEKIEDEISSIVSKNKKQIEDAEFMLAKFSADKVDEFQLLLLQNDVEEQVELNKFLKLYIRKGTIQDSIVSLEFVTGKTVEVDLKTWKTLREQHE